MKLPLFLLLSLSAVALSVASAAPASTAVKPAVVAKPTIAGAAIDLNSADASTLAREMRGIGFRADPNLNAVEVLRVRSGRGGTFTLPP